MATINLIDSEERQRQKLWLAAIKPPMYTVAIIPIAVGTAIAFAETGAFNQRVFAIFLLSAILIIAWLNLSNDVFDADTGIDQNKAHSVVNLTGNKTSIFWLSNFCLALGLGGIILINWWQQDGTVFWLIAIAVALGYTYQGPPFRFGYLGLGEIICWLAFGPLAISAAYYAQTQSFSGNALVISSLIGITTAIILFCSHFHQVEDDLAAGKRSPIVRLGTATGAVVLEYSLASVFAIAVFLMILEVLSWWSLLIFASFPFAYQLSRHVREHHHRPEKVKNCKFIAVNFHFASGILLSLGLIIERVVNRC